MPTVDQSDHSDSVKSVSLDSAFIAEPETITPEASPSLLPLDTGRPRLSSSPKKHRTNASRRLSGRPSERPAPSLNSISSLTSLRSIPTIESPGTEPEKATSVGDHVRYRQHSADRIIRQVAEWLEQEKAKRNAQNSRKHSTHGRLVHAAEATSALADRFRSTDAKHGGGHHGSHDHDLSETGLALEKLGQILSGSLNVHEDQKGPTVDKEDSYFPRTRSIRKNSSKKLMRRRSTVVSSDSEHPNDELLVPSVEAVLDNSKTLRYSGGSAASEIDLANANKRATSERDAWKQFKSEIVTLTHTLKVSGWRRVSIEQSEEIEVERLCGALTNAVYVVSPPKKIHSQTPAVSQADAPPLLPKKQPPKLLLRIYGPQVEHLIDRENELQILRRLARRKIGPRLLGTFINGRFEQFFYARTLTAADLRIPETSKQIAKRMRELHDGIDLLKEEREGGPKIWQNWDKWVERCEEITKWLDHQVVSSGTPECQQSSPPSIWMKRGLVCGVEWPLFRRTVDRYRIWLLAQYGDQSSCGAMANNLIFAHNDTQYGNLLRLEPSGQSPLLIPANEHKQLVVIDFEYASANPRGLEFANHFTEWCYNYHSPTGSYALNQKAYPTPEEQTRFLKAYVQHRPPLQQSIDDSSSDNNKVMDRTRSNSSNLLLLSSSSPSSPPVNQGAPASAGGSISSFMLDSRAPPPPGGYQEEERQREQDLQREIERLKREIRMWRVANSAQWVAWGIVQAKVEGMDEALEAARNVTPTTRAGATSQIKGGDGGDGDGKHLKLNSDPLSPELKPLVDAARDKRPEERQVETDIDEKVAAGEENEEEEEEEEFDYLSYAQDRAFFFWGDVLQLGLIRKEELPRSIWEWIKVVEY